MSSEAFMTRYETLKKMYFNPPYRTEDGEETPSIIDRFQIVQMFEAMGVELPTSPSDPIRLKGQRA